MKILKCHFCVFGQKVNRAENGKVSFLLQVPLAKEAGLCYAAVALVTDYDCWREMDDSEHVSYFFSMSLS